MPHKVFFCRLSGRSRVEIITTSREDGPPCGDIKYHVARETVFTGTDEEAKAFFEKPLVPLMHPAKCERCGYEFTNKDHQSRGLRHLYVRDDTGEEINLGAAPVGACWDAAWYPETRRGPDGRYLIVKTPGGDWAIDSRASNCTMKDDDAHRCWVRHGKPEDGTLHVDKNGHTCAAGAGSILCGTYHGFLHNGHLTDG